MFKKTLIAEFFTTVSFSQAIQSLYLLTIKSPFLRYGDNIENLENELLSYIGNEKSKIISFYNGRSAIYHCLKMIGIKKNDEIIVSGYTCVSVSNAVIQSGAKIIYSDVNKNNLGLNILELEKNITENTKVILVQHTFGKPSDILKIIDLAHSKGILVIEDCAHSLGSRVNKKQMGSFGDFAIFSTGRDKVISSVTGGFLIINNKNYFKKIDKIKSKLKMPSILLTIKNLNYNIVGYKAYKFYDFCNLGKIIIFLSRRLNLITEILTLNEKECDFNEFNYKLPNSLAYLASKQLQEIKIKSNHRRLLSDFYNESINNKYIEILFKKKKGEKNNYFRYPILLKTEKIKDEFYNYMKQNNILLGNYWSGQNIIPVGTKFKKANYIIGSCPISENISKRILTLPNHNIISIDDVSNIIELINNFKK